ncbi:MAG: hypothetical protein PHP86_13635 [Nevskiales bacterium]|nr:hypothetical protein [Nevskiales bacterium]
MIRWALAAVGLFGLLVPAQAATVYVPRPQVDLAAAQAHRNAKALPDQSSAVIAIERARLQALADPLTAEAQLQQTLLMLRDAPAPTEAARRAVAAMAGYSDQVRTDPVDPDHGRGLTVPAFQIAATARGTLRHWDKLRSGALIDRALATGDLDALRQADAGALLARARSGSRADLDLLMLADRPEPAIRAELAERLQDATLATAVLRAAPDPAGFKLIGAVAATFPPDTALTVLRDPEADSGYRSAARLALTALVPRNPTVRAYLDATLGDGWGAASAQALARADAVETLIAAAIDPSADAARQRHAVLGLQLHNSAVARDALGRIATDPRYPDALRTQVTAWLQ